MQNRRKFIANVAGLAAAGYLPGAFAQSAPAGETTFARIKRTKVLRIGGVRGQAPYYNKDLASGEWDRRHGAWRSKPSFEGSLRGIVSRPPR